MFADDPDFTSNPDTYSHWADRLDDFVNLGRPERGLSVIGGGLLAAWGLKHGSFLSSLAAFLGGLLLYRGMTGHCYVYQAGGINTARPRGDKYQPRQPLAIKPERTDTINEASWESFPASDAPSWSGGAIT